MVPCAPRYDPLIVALARALDDPAHPIAETVRRVGAAASAAGLIRPSYPHLRRLIRERRREIEAEAAAGRARREALVDAAARLAAGRFVDAYELAERLADADGRRTR